MPNGNGSPAPIHLTGNEPVIGQPQMVGATVLGTMKCPCGAHPMTLVSQLVGQNWVSMPMSCVVCQTPYVIQQVGMDPQGRLTFSIGVGAKPSLA